MSVSELIEALRKLNPNLPVLVEAGPCTDEYGSDTDRDIYEISSIADLESRVVLITNE